MCHCVSKKKYKTCCASKDIKGDYDEDKGIFYCAFDIYRPTLIEYKNKSLSIRKKSINYDESKNKSIENLFDNNKLELNTESNELKNFVNVPMNSKLEESSNTSSNNNLPVSENVGNKSIKSNVSSTSKKKMDKIFI